VEKALILIVEDQVMISKMIEAMVVDHGMEVLAICKSGEEAISIAEHRRPDIVIMDIRLQGKMDGIQTAAALQHYEFLPIIYLSDYTNPATVRKAKETRPANYLSKPFTESDLLRAIDIAIYNANALKVQANSNDDFVFLKTGPQTYSKLQYNEILYIEADRAYCKIHSIEKVHTLSISMASVAAQVSEERFVKIHRSYVVNARKVTEFSGAEVIVAGFKLPVSDQYRAQLINRLKILH
jgi:DNA-binding LytR/AlgR family response regulator